VGPNKKRDPKRRSWVKMGEEKSFDALSGPCKMEGQKKDSAVREGTFLTISRGKSDSVAVSSSGDKVQRSGSPTSEKQVNRTRSPILSWELSS